MAVISTEEWRTIIQEENNDKVMKFNFIVDIQPKDRWAVVSWGHTGTLKSWSNVPWSDVFTMRKAIQRLMGNNWTSVIANAVEDRLKVLLNNTEYQKDIEKYGAKVFDSDDNSITLKDVEIKFTYNEFGVRQKIEIVD